MTGVVQRYGVFQRDVNDDKNAPKLLTCRDLPEFATINGARTMNSKVGTLVPGKEADLLMLKGRQHRHLAAQQRLRLGRWVDGSEPCRGGVHRRPSEEVA